MTPEGVIYYGGTGGLTWFHPDSIHDDGFHAQVAITQFRVFQEPRLVPPEGADPVTLDYWANTFTFEFAMLDHRNPGENQCSYMLEGADTRWVLPGPERTVTYANVPPGEYRFRVRGESADGVPTANEASVAIIVGRPYWQTWWFRVVAALAVVGVILSVMQFRMRHAVAQERLRLQIASDLHDDIGSSLSSIALVTDNIQKSLDETHPGRRQLRAVSVVAREAADRLKDDVWIVNPGTDTLDNLLLRMKDATKTILGQIPYSFHAEISHGQRKLDMGFRKHFLLIYKETLHNVLKHAAAQHVAIAVHMTENTLQLDIADDGRGFDPDSASGGNGLLNMRRRAAAVNGLLQIDSTPGCGTSLRLRVRIP